MYRLLIPHIKPSVREIMIKSHWAPVLSRVIVYFDNLIFHRLQRRYRIGIGCRWRPIKIPDFQPIFNILLPKCFASGALLQTPLGDFRRPRLPVEKRCRGPHRIAGPRAPRLHDPPLRTWMLLPRAVDGVMQQLRFNEGSVVHRQVEKRSHVCAFKRSN